MSSSDRIAAAPKRFAQNKSTITLVVVSFRLLSIFVIENTGKTSS